MKASPLFRFAQISDIHLIEPGSEAPLRTVLARIQQERPDFVLFSGDETENGSAEQYALFLECLQKLDLPYHILPGNHDLGNAGMSQWYQERFGALNTAWEIGGCCCLTLDTTNDDPVPGNWHGRVEAPALEWLRDTLEAIPPEKPLLLFTHHGLVGRQEDLTLDVVNAEEVLSYFQGRRLIAGFNGHAHRLSVHHWDAVPFISVPALTITRETNGVAPGYLQATVYPDAVQASLALLL